MHTDIEIYMDQVSMILSKRGLEPGGRVQKKFTIDVRKYCEPYVPMDKKVLINNVTYDKNYESFTYQSPYAHFLYEGRLMVDPKTGSSYARKGTQKIYKTPTQELEYKGGPMRGKHWDKRMWADNGEKIINSIQKYVDRGGK